MFSPFVMAKVPVTVPPVVRNVKVSPTAGKKVLSRLTFRVPSIRAFPEIPRNPNWVPAASPPRPEIEDPSRSLYVVAVDVKLAGLSAERCFH